MIEISEVNYIAEGLARKVYRHPYNNELCIKIGKPKIKTSHLYKEIKYYNKIKNKDTSKYDYQFYVKYYGEVVTNLGTGFVFDLIKDETTNNVSLTLRHYLEMINSPFSDELLIKEISRLKRLMVVHKIFVGDLRARNICVKKLKDNSIELIVIDGIGHRDFFPLADWFHYFAKKKVERRFQKAKLNSLKNQRELIKRMREEGHLIV